VEDHTPPPRRSRTERLGESVGILTRRGVLRILAALAGFILLFLAADRSGDIGRYGGRDAADNARGIAALGLAIGAGLCFLGATRR
jgi:hypothetical protein